VAKLLADRLGYLYIDTGAMYRAVTYLAIRKGIPCTDEEELTKLAGEAQISFKRDSSGKQLVFCDGKDITEELRTPRISNMVSLTAKHGRVRRELVKKQQNLAKNQNVVMDGRDIGTVVLPAAELKVFLTASLEERAIRRYLELKARGYSGDLESVAAEVAARDEVDEKRTESPLHPAGDAVIYDTTGMTLEKVVTDLLGLVNLRITEGER
jgi:cytidylate kinase